MAAGYDGSAGVGERGAPSLLPGLSVEGIAEHFGLAPNYLSDWLAKHYEFRPVEYVTRRHIIAPSTVEDWRAEREVQARRSSRDRFSVAA